MRLWPGNNFTFLFSLQTIFGLDTQRERERERRESYWSTRSHPSTSAAIYLAPPLISHHHRRPIHPDRSHPTKDRSTEDHITLDRSHRIEIASPQTDPPKIDLIGVVVTHDQSCHPLIVTHHHLVTFLSLPITQIDLSLSLHFWSLSLPPSLSLIERWSLTNGVVLIFVFLSL